MDTHIKPMHIKPMTDTEKQNKEELDDIKKRLRNGPEIINCDVDELKYIKKPVGKSIYKYAIEEKQQRKLRRNKAYIPGERITCDLCGVEYTRSNKCFHERTKYHITYKIVNDKLKQLILN